MSYINNALRKVQKDKDSRYVGYDHIVSAPGKEPKKPRRWFPMAILLTFLLCAAGITASLYWPEEKKMPVSPLRVSNPQSAVPAPPMVVAQHEPIKNKPVEIAPAMTTAVVEAKPKIEKSLAAEKNIENSRNVLTKTAKPQQEGTLKKSVPITQTVSAKTERTQVKDKIADVETLYAQAIQKQQQGNLEEAKNLYKQVIIIDPQNVQALNNLGVVYMKKKIYKSAIFLLNDALRIKPDYADAHYNLACVYAKTNDTESSLLRLKDAIDLNPQVRTWAKTDRDLDNLSTLSAYKKLMEKQ